MIKTMKVFDVQESELPQEMKDNLFDWYCTSNGSATMYSVGDSSDLTEDGERTELGELDSLLVANGCEEGETIMLYFWW